jgi:hypothetical protein
MGSAILFAEDREMPSPTFMAKFADGVVTRMSCWCEEPEQLDLQRGIKLSQAAYASRTKKEPPSIVEGRFVKQFTNEVIKEYTVAELVRPSEGLREAAE